MANIFLHTSSYCNKFRLQLIKLWILIVFYCGEKRILHPKVVVWRLTLYYLQYTTKRTPSKIAPSSVIEGSREMYFFRRKEVLFTGGWYSFVNFFAVLFWRLFFGDFLWLNFLSEFLKKVLNLLFRILIY